MSTFHVEVDADDDLLCVAAIATKEGWGAAELRSVIAVSEFLTDARSRFNVDEVLAAMDEPSKKVKKEIYCVACERVVHSERQACENMQCSLYRYVKSISPSKVKALQKGHRCFGIVSATCRRHGRCCRTAEGATQRTHRLHRESPQRRSPRFAMKLP